MKNYYPIYSKVENWTIIDSRIIHDYSEDERPFKVVNVEIGKLIYDDNHNTSITRWITNEEYEWLLKNSGVVIW